MSEPAPQVESGVKFKLQQKKMKEEEEEEDLSGRGFLCVCKQTSDL